MKQVIITTLIESRNRLFNMKRSKMSISDRINYELSIDKINHTIYLLRTFNDIN